jgi:hypothetical protein
MSGRKVYQDKKSICSDCAADFTITTREQVFLETLGYRSPKRCQKCRRSGKNKKGVAQKVGTSVREMFEAGEFQKLFEPPAGSEATETPVPAPAASPEAPVSVIPRTPEENIHDMKKFFVVIPIQPDQPEATLEDIKVLMTRANKMRWPSDTHKCRLQSCSANGHIHPYFKTDDGKSLIRNLYNVESSKELRKPQIDFLYEQFGNVLAGRSFLDRNGQNSVYIATSSGHIEEEEEDIPF